MSKCICCENMSQYRCPQCRNSKYCSISCYQTHKNTCTGPLVSEQKGDISSSTQSKTEEKFDLLGNNSSVISQLKDSKLRELIKTIVYSDNPSSTLSDSLENKQLEQFALTCLSAMESGLKIERNLNTNKDTIETFRYLLSQSLCVDENI